jgi:putative transposase
MIDDKHDLPLTRQAVLLNISRSSLYYESAGPSLTDLEIMREMDRLHMDYAVHGSTNAARCSDNGCYMQAVARAYYIVHSIAAFAADEYQVEAHSQTPRRSSKENSVTTKR